MLNKLNTYFNESIQHLRFWGLQKKQSMAAAGSCCLSITSQQIHLVYAQNVANKIQLQLLETISYQRVEGLLPALVQLVKSYHLEGVPCSLILEPENYQLLLLDALPVAPSEFQSAIRWKIKELLAFPISDAIIDQFPVPQQKPHDAKKSIMVVVARNSFLQTMTDKIMESGLVLRQIDIPELALRNITALYELDEKSTALIYLHENKIQLSITRQKMLYLQRHFDFGMKQLRENSDNSHAELDRLALEMQRSFDYYQSQWRHAAPTRILLTSAVPSMPFIAEYLSKALSLSVQILDMRDVLMSRQDFPIETQGRYLPLIGGILKGQASC